MKKMLFCLIIFILLSCGVLKKNIIIKESNEEWLSTQLSRYYSLYQEKKINSEEWHQLNLSAIELYLKKIKTK